LKGKNCFFNKVARFTFVIVLFLLNYAAKGQSNSAIDSLKKVLLNSPDDTAKVRTYNTLFSLTWKTGNYKEGLTIAQQNLALSQKLKFQKGIADAYNNIGLMYENMDSRDTALSYYFKSLAARDTIKNKKQMSATYGNIANLYQARGDYVEAIKYNITALKLKEEIGDSAGMGITYNNVGLVYFNQNNYKEAIANYEKSMSISSLLKNKRNMAMTANNFGTVYQSMNQNDDAIIWLNKAIELNNALGNKSWLSKNYTNLGNSYNSKAAELKKAGNLEGFTTYNQKAMVAFEESLKRLTSDENKDDYMAACNSIGLLCINLGKLIEAESYCKKSLALTTENDNKKIKQETFEFSGLLYNELARQSNISDSLRVIYLKASIDYYEKANELKGQRLNEDNTKQIAEIKTKYETEKKDNEIKLLGKDNELKSASLRQQDFALQLAFLEKEKNKDEIALLNKDKDFQALQLNKTQQELKNRELETKANAAELELTKKDKTIKEKQLSEQTLYRNLLVVGSILLLAFGLLLFNRFRLSKQLESQRALLNERKRISNELHDDLGAQLSTARMFLSSLKNNAEGEKNKTLVENSIQLIDGSINDLRKIMDDLQVSTLQEKGYLIATEELVNKINLLQQINFSLSHVGLEKRLEQKTEHQLFRITQELINNSMKYAKAKNVYIDLVNRDGKIILLYEDDGIGYDIKDNKRGYGLTNIETRTKSVNGVVEFDSAPGKGARTIIEIPFVYAG